MKTVCASSVYHGREAFETLGDVVVVPDGDITNEVVADADALVTRSKTKINQELLSGTNVQFVGTATAGFDHIDTVYAEQHGIAWTQAAGCNADSVAQYFITALMVLAERYGIEYKGKTIGVVGVGQIGSRVCRLAEALGMRVLKNDPPVALQTGDPTFLSLDILQKEADLLTFHVPLIHDGPFPTDHMVDFRFWEDVKPGVLFVNACRGEVVDGEALKGALHAGIVRHAVLDVWEEEPDYDMDLLDMVELGTPHIAGYSIDGKLNGTRIIYEHACRHFGLEPTWTPAALPALDKPVLEVDARGRTMEDIVRICCLHVYDILQDDAQMHQGSREDTAARKNHFKKLRKEYPVRREWPALTVQLENDPESWAKLLKTLGFRVK